MATSKVTTTRTIVVNLYGGTTKQFTDALERAFVKINIFPRYTLNEIISGKTGKPTGYCHLVIANTKAHNLILGRRADGGKLANKRVLKEGWVKPSIGEQEALTAAIKGYENSIEEEIARLTAKKEELSKEVDILDDLAHFGNGSVQNWLEADEQLDLVTQQLENARVTWGDYGAIEDMVREEYNPYTVIETDSPIELRFPYTKAQIAWWEKKTGEKSDTHGAFKIWEEVPRPAKKSRSPVKRPSRSGRKPRDSKQGSSFTKGRNTRSNGRWRK